jgi:hypothetical protein
MNYTARESLHIRMSFTYLISLAMGLMVAITFQIIGKVSMAELLPIIASTLLCITIAFIIYRNKKNRKESDVLIWIISFITLAIPFLAKISYARKFGWTMAMESYNSSVVVVFMIFISSLYLKSRLFKIISITGIAAWSLFVYIALNSGAEYSYNVISDGKIFSWCNPHKGIFLYYKHGNYLLCSIQMDKNYK